MSVSVTKNGFNVREKLKQLQKPIGLKGSELMRAETAQEARELVGAGRKNLIINGNFRISQRGNYTSPTAIGATTYTLDRWKTLWGGGATIQHKTNQLLPNGDISDSALATVTSTGYTGFQQFIEFPEIYSGQTFTVSFWIKTNYISTGVNVYNGSTFVLSSSRGRLNETSGEWKYFSKTFTMPTSGNSNFRIEFWTGNGITPTGSYIEIAQVQVEKGTLATEFEHRSYGEELALCQRYFYKHVFDIGYAIDSYADGITVYQRDMIVFPCTMRTVPITSGSLSGASTNIRSGDQTTSYTAESRGHAILAFRAAAAGRFYQIVANGDKISFDAEL